jgi:hypothetical protein
MASGAFARGPFTEIPPDPNFHRTQVAPAPAQAGPSYSAADTQRRRDDVHLMDIVPASRQDGAGNKYGVKLNKLKESGLVAISNDPNPPKPREGASYERYETVNAGAGVYVHVRVDQQAADILKANKKADGTPLTPDNVLDSVNSNTRQHKRAHPEQHSEAPKAGGGGNGQQANAGQSAKRAPQHAATFG